MRKRTSSPKGASASRPSAGGQKSFRKSGDGPSRPFAKARPEVESRFSKPSIKKSSLRVTAQNADNKGQKSRPNFDHERTDNAKPRSFSKRDDYAPGDKKPFTRSEKPSFHESGRSKGFGNARSAGDRSFKTDKPFRERSGDAEKPFRSERRSDSDRPVRSERTTGADRPFRSERTSGAEKPFRSERTPGADKPFRAERTTGSEKPFRSERSSASDRPFRSERPSGTEKREPREFKKKDDSERSFRTTPGPKESEEPVEDLSGLNRRVGKYRTAPGYDLSDYQKKSGKKPTQESTDIRLNRYIANAGICSRREADDLISSGQISVNGKTVTEMGYKVNPTDIVKYGKRALNPEKMVYILINKPKDYITTTDDPEERKTVLDLIKGACSERVYPVGRLDRNTTGLLLMTNDGELAGKLTHPSSGIKKIYQAELDKPITTEDFESLQAGVQLEDGFIRPDEVGLVTPDAMVVGLEIHSGRNRVVRRIFEHLGYEVQKLDRTVFAGLNKKDLPRGKWRFLSEKEVIKLKYLL